MKDRILAYLDDFSNGRRNELAEELKLELGLDDNTFRERSQDAMASILHEYSQFSISTIDAFFQRVIRSFTRESGLIGDYRLEVDTDAVMKEVIDNLIDELGNDKDLTEWVVEFAKANLENERAWDVRHSLNEFAREIFKEEFKEIEDVVMVSTQDRAYFRNLLNELQSRKYAFINFVKTRAFEAMNIIKSNGLVVTDFKWGGSGSVYTFFNNLSVLSSVSKFQEKGKRVMGEFQFSNNWPPKKSRNEALVIKLADEKLMGILQEILGYWDDHFEEAISAEVALNNFYAFGLIADIARKLKEYKDENNLMLLADAPKFLNGVIRDSDTPFIYEKVGSFYKNYLIDEFQDTSGMQWKNLLPLLTNSLDQGYVSSVVGDVKQAIYRWRGGDLSLLQHNVEQQIGDERVDTLHLNSNYRSAPTLVNFNNGIFKQAASLIAKEVGHPVSEQAYIDVAQETAKDMAGFVHVHFLETEVKEDKWKDAALDLVPQWLERLQDQKVEMKDIAILVRKNDEGQDIVAHLLKYRNSDKARSDCRYDVISNESLRLDGAATVNLLLAAMKYLLNPMDAIARAQLSYEYSKLSESDRDLTEVFAVSEQVFFESGLPDDFTQEKASLKKLPLFELTETLITIFKLGSYTGELTYLQAFQDLVMEFYSRERNDLGLFLEWWEENKKKKSIQVSGEVDAAQIITIHKSKGLQFKYVLIPFCSWGLDHDIMRSPNLWVSSDKPPFENAGYVPVKYSSKLDKTYFKSYYEEEKTRCYLDNLNLLYVAFTRAEQGLITFAPAPGEQNFKNSAASLLYECIQSDVTFQTSWKAAEKVLEFGDISPVASTHKKGMSSAISLREYTATSWRNKLVIRQAASTYFDAVEEDSMEKARYGVYVHNVLSKINHADDLENELADMMQSGLITSQEREPLEHQLKHLFADPHIASWFSSEWEVLNEVPVLLPGGKERRIDRLVYRDKKAIVIDFKTGKPTAYDQRQVMDYMQMLRQMNFLEVEGYLLYIRTGDVVSVKAGKTKAVRKKDEHQLGLGL